MLYVLVLTMLAALDFVGSHCQHCPVASNTLHLNIF